MIGTGFFNSGNYNAVRVYNPLLIQTLNKLFTKNLENRPLFVAEFGCGAGLFTQFLLQSNITIKKLFLIDPDEKAIEQHKTLFLNNPRFNRFVYIQTAAESSTLERESVNGLFCMQAFHWLNREAVRQEFLRILKPMAKIFIAGKFLSPINEATAQYLQITRFGKRLYGMSDNREAYTPEVMEAIFGHPVKKQTVCRESEYKTLDQLKALIQLRIDSSGDEDIKSNTGYIQEQAERFFHQYADSNNTVTLISETIFYCGPLS